MQKKKKELQIYQNIALFNEFLKAESNFPTYHTLHKNLKQQQKIKTNLLWCYLNIYSVML